MGCATSSLTGRCRGSAINASQRDKLLTEFKTISSVLQPDAMMMKVVEAMKNLLPVERASVFMVDHQAGVMRTFNEVRAVAAAAAGNRTTPELSEIPFSVSIPIDTGLAGAVVFSAQSEVVADAQRDSRFNRTVDEQTGIKTRNVISVPVKLNDEILDEIDERAKEQEPQRGLFRQMTRPITRDTSAAPRQSAALKTGGEVVAVLQALNRNGNFTSADQTVLEALASLLAGVFARAQIIEAAARERKRSEALLEVAQAVNSTRECHLKALSITEAIKKGCDCERGTLVLVDEVNQEQVFVTANQDMYGMRLPLGTGISGESPIPHECRSETGYWQRIKNPGQPEICASLRLPVGAEKRGQMLYQPRLLYKLKMKISSEKHPGICPCAITPETANIEVHFNIMVLY